MQGAVGVPCVPVVREVALVLLLPCLASCYTADPVTLTALPSAVRGWASLDQNGSATTAPWNASNGTLVMLDSAALQGGAVCLDGSSGSCYIRPGAATNTHDGWCSSRAGAGAQAMSRVTPGSITASDPAGTDTRTPGDKHVAP